MTADGPDPFTTAALRRQGKAVHRRYRAGAADGGSAPSRPAPERRKVGDRMRYWFDTALSRGPSVVIGWLGLLTLAIIAFSALVITLFRISGINGGERLGFGEAFWQSLLRVVDAGTFAGDSGWLTRSLGLLITLAGIFLAGSLIGLIANGVDQRIEQLRKGRSVVIEDDHSLILGWSDRVPAIVRELIVANESRKRTAIVILADVDKTEMEDTLRDQIDDFGTTRLVCRSGSTSTVAHLDLVNIAGARSIIVIGEDDAVIVKSLLAIRAAAPEGSLAPVIAEASSTETSTAIRSLFGPRVVIVNSDAIVAELTAQACRQRGLSQVFRDLLDFDGDEIYFDRFEPLVGRSYADAVLAFENASIIGLLDADGRVLLNPAPESIVGADDQLIGVASDDSTFVCTGVMQPSREIAPATIAPEPEARRMVLVGWSQLGPRVVAELDEFLGSETVVEIIVDPRVGDVDAIRASVRTTNIEVEITTYDGGPRELAVHAARRALHEVIVLGRREGMSAEEADAATLLTLLAFTQVVQAHELGPVRIVAELLEQRHAPLAQATGADDFIVSDELTSLMIAQLSERHELEQLFTDLFDRGGATIELVPAARYGAAEATCFADVVAAASRHGQSALGYRRAADGVVVLNPPKSDALRLLDDDGIVVIC